MTIDFSHIPPEDPVPNDPPSRLLWTMVFFVLTLSGVFAVLFFWPQGEPTQTPKFWITLIAFPTGIAALVVLQRYSIYEGKVLGANIWNTVRNEYVDEAFEQASQPLVVLGTALRFETDDDINQVTKIIDGTLKLEARASTLHQNTSVTARWLSPRVSSLAGDDTQRHTELLRWICNDLFTQLHSTIARLAPTIPLNIRLQVSGYTADASPLAIVQACWDEQQLRRATVRLCAKNIDLMALDRWMNGPDELPQNDVTLLVLVNLNSVLASDPPNGSAEAGVAMLLAFPEMVTARQLSAIARIHRPMQDTLNQHHHALTYALRWAKAAPHEVARIWQTGLDGETLTLAHTALQEVGVTADRDPAIPEINMDVSVGHTANLAGWLSLACAIAGAKDINTAQLVMERTADAMLYVVTAPEATEI